MSENQKWGFRTHPVRTILLIILALIGGMMFAAAVDATWIKANAVDCFKVGPVGECQTVTDKHRKVAKKVREGVIPQAKNTFDMRPAFAQKKKVRAVIVARIKAGMIASQGQAGAEKIMCCTDEAAAAAYLRLVDHPVCAAVNIKGADKVRAQFGWDYMCRLSKMPAPDDPPGGYITAEEAKKVATVFFCGTGMALAIGMSGASAGTTAAIGLSAAGGCLMSVWD